MLVGCGILTLLLGIAAIALVVKAKDVLAYAMGQLRAQVVARLPLDLTDAERDHLENAFAETISRIREGKIDPVALQELQKRVVAAAQSGERRISRPDLEELVRALDAFNGAGAKPEEPAAPAAPEATPPPAGQSAAQPPGT